MQILTPLCYVTKFSNLLNIQETPVSMKHTEYQSLQWPFLWCARNQQLYYTHLAVCPHIKLRSDERILRSQFSLTSIIKETELFFLIAYHFLGRYEHTAYLVHVMKQEILVYANTWKYESKVYTTFCFYINKVREGNMALLSFIIFHHTKKVLKQTRYIYPL